MLIPLLQVKARLRELVEVTKLPSVGSKPRGSSHRVQLLTLIPPSTEASSVIEITVSGVSPTCKLIKEKNFDSVLPEPLTRTQRCCDGVRMLRGAGSL